MYTALYRSERPEVFSSLLGQEHVVKILKHQIETNTVSHAYLFCGTRGTGKTTVARLLAKAVNCLSDGEKPCGVCENCRAIKDGTFIDVIEIDAASNNRVDNARELNESVNYPPVAGKKKVYIIDEAHMLTTEACNALLKTIEEPPDDVMFIFATTDPQKLPLTILSRCMRLDFKRVPEDAIAKRMGEICERQGVKVTDGALRLLAANADGSVRDGLSILDQCLSGGDKEITRNLVLDFLGIASDEFFIDLTEEVLLHNPAGGLVLLDQILRDGKDVKQLLNTWLSHYRSLLLAKYINNPEDILNMSSENVERVKSQSARITVDEINEGIVVVSKAINDARYSSQPRVLMELAIVTLATGISEDTVFTRKGVADTAPQVRVQQPIKTTIKTRPSPSFDEEKTDGSRPAVSDSGDWDLEEIWDMVFEKTQADESSLGMLKIDTALAEIGDSEFKVITSTAIKKKLLENNSDKICSAMAEITGKHRAMSVKVGSGNEGDSDSTGQQVKNKLHDVFGMDVKLK